MSDAELQSEEETDPRSVQPVTARGFLRNTLPLLVYTAVIFYMGGSPALPMPPSPIVGTDKVLHFGAFGVFALLAHRAVAYQWSALPPRVLRRIAVMAAAFGGGLLELYQLGFPNRSCEVWDLVADSLGALAAIGILWAWSQVRPTLRGPG
jgi:VanZ family protein